MRQWAIKPPSEDEFRFTGWTADAINYPITIKAFLYRCEFNGIDPGLAPETWHYAPNEWVQQDLNTKGEEAFQKRREKPDDRQSNHSVRR